MGPTRIRKVRTDDSETEHGVIVGEIAETGEQGWAG
jgi:hypothetical protein